MGVEKRGEMKGHISSVAYAPRSSSNLILVVSEQCDAQVSPFLFWSTRACVEVDYSESLQAYTARRLCTSRMVL
jgi:hypothetical protein